MAVRTWPATLRQALPAVAGPRAGVSVSWATSHAGTPQPSWENPQQNEDLGQTHIIEKTGPFFEIGSMLGLSKRCCNYCPRACLEVRVVVNGGYRQGNYGSDSRILVRVLTARRATTTTTVPGPRSVF